MSKSDKALRTLANIITDMYGFQPQAEPDAEQALRQALTKHMLIQDEQIRKIAREEITRNSMLAPLRGEQDTLAWARASIKNLAEEEDKKWTEAPIQVGEFVAIKQDNEAWAFWAKLVNGGYLLDGGDCFISLEEEGIDKVVRMTKVIEMLNYGV